MTSDYLNIKYISNVWQKILKAEFKIRIMKITTLIKAVILIEIVILTPLSLTAGDPVNPNTSP